MKKIISLILVLLMLLPMILACDEVDETPEADQQVAAEEPTPDDSKKSSNKKTSGNKKPKDPIDPGVVEKEPYDPEKVDANGYLLDRLPTGEEALKFEGSTIKILGYEEAMNETFPKQDSARDPVQSRLYNHWKGIKEQFGIEFEVTYQLSEWANRDSFFVAARSDNADYDLIQTESLFPIVLATEGLLCNLRNLQYPDLDEIEGGGYMPWWPESVDQFTQYGGLYFIGSNSSALGISNMTVIYVDTGVVASKGMQDPVESVIRGTWTVEELTNIVKMFADAAEGVDEKNRYYGIVADSTSRLTSFLYSSGFSEIVNNADGVGELAYDEVSELEAISKGLDRFKEMWTGAQAKIHRVSGKDIYDELKESRTATFLGYIQMIRSLENTDKYTVVPLPLLKDTQSDPESAGKGYRTIHRDCFDLWCIPVTTSNKVLSGMILEANASGEYRNIGPFYYERYLKPCYANAANGRVCFDILRASVVYDLGRISQLKNVGIKVNWSDCFTEAGVKNNLMKTVGGKLTSETDNFNKMLSELAQYVDQ